MTTRAEMSNANLADASTASFLIRWQGKEAGPFPADAIGAKLAANEIGLLHEIFNNGKWITVRDFLAVSKKPEPNWQIAFATENQKEKLRFFGCTWDDGITASQANEALEECARQFPDAEATWQKNQPATEKQKEKLRYFGCTWSGDINVGQASDALLQCASDFPAKEEDWQFQKKKWNKISVAPSERATTINTAIVPKISHEGFFCGDSLTETTIPPTPEQNTDHGAFVDTFRHVAEEFLPTPEQKAELRSYGKVLPKGMTFAEAQKLIEQCKKLNQFKLCNESPIESASPFTPQGTDENRRVPGGQCLSPEPKPSDPEDQASINLAGQEQGFDLDHLVKQIKAKLAAERMSQDRTVETKAYQPAKTAEEVTIQEAAKPQDVHPYEFTIPARQVHDFVCQMESGEIKGNKTAYALDGACSSKQYTAPHRPAIQKPQNYISSFLTEYVIKRVDDLLTRSQTSIGGHWLPLRPLGYHFESLTIGISRQIADAIEVRGYCVEPDARFGSGTYERNQTLALFTPLDVDPIQPSTAYLGAANLLRLCVLITIADGKIDLVELEVFRRAIESQPGLSLTDRKRLLILEQLLAQELCPASNTSAKIAKSVTADKRLVIGKLLVEVAAANNVITDAERRALEKIFKSFEIPPETLERLIAQICPTQWPRPASIQSDVSKQDKWLWNHWRTGHPGVVIDDTTLDKKTWNLNDWKALNARWRGLHDRLVEHQTHSGKASSASFPTGSAEGSEPISAKNSWKSGYCKCCERANVVMSRSPSGEVRSYCVDCEGEIKRRVFDQKLNRWMIAGRLPGTGGKQIPKFVAAPAPPDFALDMARVSEIAGETKEVVAILSVLMEDEPEKLISPPTIITLPVPETSKVTEDGKAASQPARFNGLEAAFHPILERLLTRSSWPKNDFKSLVDEFHFMPSKVHDTLNEWADDALGDFILDGEDPVFIRRELISKETIYG